MTAFCAAIDWGTTSFRLWLLSHDGTILGERRSDEGMMHCAPNRFEEVMNKHLEALGAPRDLPVVICGMAGARQGWVEAPYLDSLTDPLDLAARATRIPNAGRPVMILPGLCQRNPREPDVMRGEETQIFGALEEGQATSVFCLPGTHSKWAHYEEGRIKRFMTFMTGEIYSVLSRHSILALGMGEEKAGDDEAFARGVTDMLADPGLLTRQLFTIRSGAILGFSAQGHASRLSGLLIGAEIAAATAAFKGNEPVTLVASGALARLYERALQLAGCAIRRVDADEAVRSGLLKAARQLWSR